MTEAEKLLQDIASGAPIKKDDEKSKARAKAAKEWVNHFVSVSKYIGEIKSKNISIATEQELIDHIVSIWENSSTEKDDFISKAMA